MKLDVGDILELVAFTLLTAAAWIRFGLAAALLVAGLSILAFVRFSWGSDESVDNEDEVTDVS